MSIQRHWLRNQNETNEVQERQGSASKERVYDREGKRSGEGQREQDRQRQQVRPTGYLIWSMSSTCHAPYQLSNRLTNFEYIPYNVPPWQLMKARRSCCSN